MVANSIINGGSIVVIGTTLHKVTDALVTVTAGSGYEFDLASAVQADIGGSIPSTVGVTKVYSIERVVLDNLGQVASVDTVYDLTNYKIQDGYYDSMALGDIALSPTEVLLPATPKNSSALLDTGDVLRVTFYYINTEDNESLYFSKACEQITDKRFLTVDKIYSNAGFKNVGGVVSGNITVNAFNQPSDNAQYIASYNYTAPKENERITITYNYNSLIDIATLGIEAVRPISADILVKEAKVKDINVTIRIVISSDYQNQQQTVLQNANDAVTSFLSANSLGTTIDASDVVNALYSVAGIDRVTIINFSYGSSGNVLSITADKNEYLSAGIVNITAESR